MADGEIQIIIKAIDEVSAELKTIEGKIDGFSKNTTKQTQAVTKSFQQSTTTLLALGNAALTVDNILSSYANLQLRLENATERVTGAQERLRFAQEKYTEILRDREALEIKLLKNSNKEKKITEELAEARKQLADKDARGILPTSKSYIDLLERISEKELELREVQFDSRRARETNSKAIVDSQREIEQAERSLTIAENNLARANNQVIGTYISIGVQITSLTASLPALITGLGNLTGATTGVTAAVGLGGLAATAGTAAALAGLFFILKEISGETPEFVQSMNARIQSLEDARDAARETEKAFYDLLIQEEKLRKTQILSGSGQFGGKVTRSDLPTPQMPKGQFTLPPMTIMKDFISRPGQAPIPFSSSDTIIGTKNPGMNTINIYIDNVMGVSASQISKSLRDELARKVTI